MFKINVLHKNWVELTFFKVEKCTFLNLIKVPYEGSLLTFFFTFILKKKLWAEQSLTLIHFTLITAMLCGKTTLLWLHRHSTCACNTLLCEQCHLSWPDMPRGFVYMGIELRTEIQVILYFLTFILQFIEPAYLCAPYAYCKYSLLYLLYRTRLLDNLDIEHVSGNTCSKVEDIL